VTHNNDYNGGKMIEFKGKILIIGFGSVSMCTLPMLVKHVNVPLGNITIMDFEDKTETLKEWTDKGVNYLHDRLKPENFNSTLSKYVSEGDLIIDLAWNIETSDFLQWCHDNKVLYVNASVEKWDPYKDQEKKGAYEKSLYHRHMLIREMISKWEEKGVTAVLDHGANPGLISHFVMQGLIDIGNKLISDKKVSEEEGNEIKRLIDERKFAELGMKLNVKVIHCSERDTQISDKPKQVNEFVNTWSVAGFHEEGIGPAEMGWGTHEEVLPPGAVVPEIGPKNQIFLQQSGINTWVYSFVPPNHEIMGMVIRHGEAFTISEKLTVVKDGKAIYRPTVHYAYMPCDAAVSSLQELRGANYELQSKQRIYTDDEISSGADILGALLMGHDYNSWWTGSDLSIEESRELVPGQNATTIQVAAGVLAAVMWMIENPNKGICVPDDLPHDYVLRVAKPYLGNFISKAYDWTPLKKRKMLFPTNKIYTKDPWQFKSFLFTP
jgi:homospermidine synthase